MRFRQSTRPMRSGGYPRAVLSSSHREGLRSSLNWTSLSAGIPSQFVRRVAAGWTASRLLDPPTLLPLIGNLRKRDMFDVLPINDQTWLICGGRDFADQEMFRFMMASMTQRKGIPSTIIHGGAANIDIAEIKEKGPGQ